ncbi:FCD domain-containing protein [Variovorax sp. EBFNA2]|uniref:FCD domain-containing protein n=1 Tax=Variovorax sp. EBFNA2 TaxID=3342097 RepID=UPI0029BFE4B5|nr:FCD domain-containing protein [Variovorax boronicumulans]WPG41396.1 FCD domain-containing protein [Variovorax boronicumulans]
MEATEEPSKSVAPHAEARTHFNQSAAPRSSKGGYAAQGVVEIPRNKGAAIRSLDLQTLEVLDVAERMTGLLARSAALGIANGRARDPIKQALAELDRANTATDGDVFARARRGLYRALLNTSGSNELKRLFPSIQMPIVYAQHRPSTLQKVRMRDCQVMCDAVLRGDAQAADEAGMAHVQNVRSVLDSIDL